MHQTDPVPVARASPSLGQGAIDQNKERVRLLQLVIFITQVRWGLCTILGLPTLNFTLMTCKFKMLLLKLTVLQIRSEDWLVTIDLHAFTLKCGLNTGSCPVYFVERPTNIKLFNSVFLCLHAPSQVNGAVLDPR